MRTTQFFLKTKKEAPREAKLISFKLLAKAGFIFQTSSGSFSLLPLGLLVFEKLKNLIRQELKKAGCQEILMPIVHPARLWEESGRLKSTGPELLRAFGRDENYVLAMTHEEIVTDIVRKLVASHEDLPFVFNQFQTKFRDEPRPRGGLLRLKEFVMQDAYSFDKDEEGLEKNYQSIVKAYDNIFKRIGLNAKKVAASSGIMGGNKSEEFMLLSDAGEDTVVLCSKCGYKANIEYASSRPSLFLKKARQAQKQEVKTPKMTTVDEVAGYLKIESSSIIKSMLYKQGEDLILVLIRGDIDINDEKLKIAIGKELVPAKEEDFKKHGIILGFIGPVGLKDIPIYADYSIKLGGPFVAGANKNDAHITGLTTKDFKIDKWIDIAEVKPGDKCINCGEKLKVKKAIELSHTFKLGIKYSNAMQALFTDKDGKKKPILMGSYGIGLERLMASIVELNNDENGIIWPKEVAPFEVYLMDILTNKKDKRVIEGLYNNLIADDIEVLYDDRDKTAGFKFAEADLIGCPLRLTVSSRSLAKNSVELKERDKKEVELVETEKIVEIVKKKLQ